MTALVATEYQHEAQRGDTPMLWHGAAAPCQLAERPGTSIKTKAVVLLALPVACSARGGGSDTTALVAKVTRQLRMSWQGRNSASATD